jgi:hypothetical protein
MIPRWKKGLILQGGSFLLYRIVEIWISHPEGRRKRWFRAPETLFCGGIAWSETQRPDGVVPAFASSVHQRKSIFWGVSKNVTTLWAPYPAERMEWGVDFKILQGGEHFKQAS